MLYNIASYLLLAFCRGEFNLEIRGRESFPSARPFILASNHISNLDPIVMGISALPRQVRYLAKEELFKNPVCGLILRDLGAIPLKRSHGDIGALRQALKILKTNPLVMFPQGTRTSNFDSFSAGVGFLCKKAAVPVVAAKITGTDVILPSGSKFFRSGSIKVIFSLVRTITQADTYEEAARKVIETIKSL